MNQSSLGSFLSPKFYGPKRWCKGKENEKGFRLQHSSCLENLWVITIAIRSVTTAYYIMNNFNKASLVLWEADISCSSC